MMGFAPSPSTTITLKARRAPRLITALEQKQLSNKLAKPIKLSAMKVHAFTQAMIYGYNKHGFLRDSRRILYTPFRLCGIVRIGSHAVCAMKATVNNSKGWWCDDAVL
jgi:hypothetical protein